MMELKFGSAYTADSCATCTPSNTSNGGSSGGGGGEPGDVNWDDIEDKPSTLPYEWTVGDVGWPGDGESDYVNAAFVGVPLARITVTRGGLTQPKSDRGNGGTWISKASTGDNKITFHAALTISEVITVSISPL